MKFIIAILLLVIGAFAQNGTYVDGTACQCDSVSTSTYTNDSGGVESWEVPYVNGKIHGIEYYYINHSLYRSAEYADGKRHGITLVYDRGIVSAHALYNRGYEQALIVLDVDGDTISNRTFTYNTKGFLIKMVTQTRALSDCVTIYSYTKNIRTTKLFYSGVLESVYEERYKLRDLSNASVLSENILIDTLITELHYGNRGYPVTSVIVDGAVSYYVCATGQEVLEWYKCD